MKQEEIQETVLRWLLCSTPRKHSVKAGAGNTGRETNLRDFILSLRIWEKIKEVMWWGMEVEKTEATDTKLVCC